MEEITLSDGATFHVVAEGTGPNLVLMSGLGGLASFWDPFVAKLGDGYRIIRFDQRGIGRSERGTRPITIGTLAEDSWEIVDAIGCSDPILCGHSTGGAIAQEMARSRPGAARALLLNGTWAGPNWFMETVFESRLALLAQSPAKYARLSILVGYPPRWLNEHLQILQGATDNPPDKVLTSVIQERIQALLRHDCRAILPDINTPALVLGSEDDMIVPPYLQEELVSGLPQGRLHMFPQGGHFYPVTKAEETAAVIKAWLSEQGLAQ